MREKVCYLKSMKNELTREIRELAAKMVIESLLKQGLTRKQIAQVVEEADYQNTLAQSE